MLPEPRLPPQDTAPSVEGMGVADAGLWADARRSGDDRRAMPGDLYCGDNLEVMRTHIASESIDLVYLDPPFNSDRTYNVIGKGSRSKGVAFVDSWAWDAASERSFRELTDRPARGVDVPPSLREMMVALRPFLDRHRDMLAYLSMMAIRLVETRRVLKKTGSLYLHCDPSASHYLKVILDALYGPENFRREIIWRSGWVSGFKTRTANWIRNHDTLLYYLRDRREPDGRAERAVGHVSAERPQLAHRLGDDDGAACRAGRRADTRHGDQGNRAEGDG